MAIKLNTSNFRWQRGAEGTLTNAQVENVLQDAAASLQKEANRQHENLVKEINVEDNAERVKELETQVETLTTEKTELEASNKTLTETNDKLDKKLKPILAKDDAAKASILFKGLALSGAEYDLAKKGELDLSEFTLEELQAEKMSDATKVKLAKAQDDFKKLDIPDYLKFKKEDNSGDEITPNRSDVITKNVNENNKPGDNNEPNTLDDVEIHEREDGISIAG